MRYTKVTQTLEGTPAEFIALARHAPSPSAARIASGQAENLSQISNSESVDASWTPHSWEDLYDYSQHWLDTSQNSMAISYRNGREEREKYWAKRAEEEEYVRRLLDERKLRDILVEESRFARKENRNPSSVDVARSWLTVPSVHPIVKAQEAVDLEVVEPTSGSLPIPLKVIAVEPKKSRRTRLWIFPLLALLFFTKLAFTLSCFAMDIASDIVRAILWAV